MKKRTEFQEQFDERGSRTELGLQTSGICSEMKGEKLERKMLEREEREFGSQDIESVTCIDLKINKIVGTMASRKWCSCFIILVCVWRTPWILQSDSQQLLIWLFLQLLCYWRIESPRLLDKVNLSVILAWLLLLSSFSSADFLHTVTKLCTGNFMITCQILVPKYYSFHKTFFHVFCEN